MCNIYWDNCVECGSKACLHIGGYCVPEESVKFYCPNCTRKLAKLHKHPKAGWPLQIDGWYVHVDEAARSAQDDIWVGDGPNLQEAIILCDVKEGHDLNFN